MIAIKLIITIIAIISVNDHLNKGDELLEEVRDELNKGNFKSESYD